MAIDVEIKAAPPAPSPPEKPQKVVELDMRRSLDGNLMIFDHEDIDIVLVPTTNKIIAFPKELMEDRVYATQDRFFYFLRKKGVINPETVKGGSVYGSFEATISKPIEEGVSAPQVALSVIDKFIKEEKPYFRKYHELEDEWEKELTDPSNMDSTALGEVPQASKKGSLRPGYIRGPYGMTSFYRYEE